MTAFFDTITSPAITQGFVARHGLVKYTTTMVPQIPA